MRGRFGFWESSKCYLLRVTNCCVNFVARLGEFSWNLLHITASYISNPRRISPNSVRRETRMKCHLSGSGLHFGLREKSRERGSYLAMTTMSRSYDPLIPLSQITSWNKIGTWSSNVRLLQPVTRYEIHIHAKSNITKMYKITNVLA